MPFSVRSSARWHEAIALSCAASELFRSKFAQRERPAIPDLALSCLCRRKHSQFLGLPKKFASGSTRASQINGKSHHLGPPAAHDILRTESKLSRQCGARTKSGKPCRSPATKKGRCRLHGGANGSGGPPGERNGQYRHGERTKAAIASTKPSRPSKPGAWSSALNGTTLQNTAAGSTTLQNTAAGSMWPSLNSAS
jgi:hypothetical protein